MKKIYFIFLLVFIAFSCNNDTNDQDCNYYNSGAEATVEVTNNKSVVINFSIESDFALIQGGRNINPGSKASFAVLSGLKSYEYTYLADPNPSSGNGYETVYGSIDVVKCENNELIIN